MYTKNASAIIPPPPLVTIGGAEDGRAPVVVVDEPHKVPAAGGEGDGQQQQGDTTSVLAPNQPAPGPDVFENPPGQQAQSRSMDVGDQDQQAQHEVTAGAGPKTVEKVIPAPPPVPAAGAGDEAKTGEKEEKAPEGGHQPKVEETKEVKQEQHETGAKDEADAQRDRVVGELFGKEDN